MPLVVLFIVVSELDKQQVAGGEPLLHGRPEAFLAERAGASAGKGVVFDFHAFLHIFRQSPAPAPERGLVIFQSCRTCFRSMTQT